MSNTQDPFDEFEFKPLTEGLGFHKKTVSLKEGLKKTGVLDDELQSLPGSLPKSLLDESVQRPMTKRHTYEDVLSALEKTPMNRSPSADLEFTETLPRERKQAMEVELPQPLQSPFPAPDLFKAPPLKKITPVMPEFIDRPAPLRQKPSTGTRRGAADSPQGPRLVPESVSFASASLDGIIILAIALIFIIAMVLVTKVDLNGIIRHLNKDHMTQLSLAALLLAVMQMYVIIARSFFGRTVGEWTFDLQIGRDEDQKREIFPLKVAARSLITTFTGVIVLPFLSGLLDKDLAGRISGAYLYRQR